MKVLIACEESQAVTIEFRKLGIEAFSCDVQDCSGGYPEWHIKDDLFNVMYDNWDLMIAFPPCTHLAISGAPSFAEKIKDGRQQEAIDFFMKIANAPIKYMAIENPVGIMSKVYRKPNQIIHPYFFGDEAQKKTCLWLKNLPKLYHNAQPNLFDNVVTHVSKGDFYEWTCKVTGRKKRQACWYSDAFFNSKTPSERSKQRSKTFKGIAYAMANQWSEYILNKNTK